MCPIGEVTTSIHLIHKGQAIGRTAIRVPWLVMKDWDTLIIGRETAKSAALFIEPKNIVPPIELEPIESRKQFNSIGKSDYDVSLRNIPQN